MQELEQWKDVGQLVMGCIRTGKWKEKLEELMNERAEIWQGLEDHDRVAVMDRA